MRKQSWPTELDNYINQEFSFEWGVVDCVKFCVGSNNAILVEDFIIEEYSNKKEALKAPDSRIPTSGLPPSINLIS